jgi:hypothetical protein
MNKNVFNKKLIDWLLPLGIVLALFAISFGVRWEALRNMPQGYGYYNQQYQRWINAEVNSHVLANIQTYRTYPTTDHWFASYILGSAEDTRFLPSKKIPEISVYSSFSPAVFIFPYAVFKVLHLPVTYTGLELLNLFLHFTCIVLIYSLLRALFPRKDRWQQHFIPILGASVYTFSTVTLHNHLSVYWSHQLLQPFYFAAMLRFIQTRGRFRLPEIALWATLLPLISWTGFVMNAAFGLYFMVKLTQERKRAWLARTIATAISALFALGAIVLQVLFVSGVGVNNYIDKVFSRIEARSFDAGYVTLPKLIETYARDVLYDIGAYIILLIALLSTGVYLRYKLRHVPLFTWGVLLLSALPVLETIPLIEHDTVYGFGRLKLVLPLVIALCIALNQILNHWQWSKRAVAILTIAFVLPAAAHVVIYQKIYGDGPHHYYQEHLRLSPQQRLLFSQ